MVLPVLTGVAFALIRRSAGFESQCRYMVYKTREETFKEFDCVDCSVNTHAINEYYMVQFDLWNSVMVSQNTGMLCIGCLEDRLGRTLTTEDFIEAPINYGCFGWSDRMKDRLGPKFTGWVAANV